MTAAMTIGEVARLTGVPAKTIRYYEEIALIPAAERAPNGYRTYDGRSVGVLRFVKRARQLGFTIEDVAELLALWRDESRATAEVKAIAQHHIQRVEDKIAELESLRRTLAHLVEHCHGDHRPDCPILDDLVEGPQSGRPDRHGGGAP